MSVIKLEFDDIFRDISAKVSKIDQSKFIKTGKVPVIDQGKDFIAGYSDEESM